MEQGKIIFDGPDDMGHRIIVRAIDGDFCDVEYPDIRLPCIIHDVSINHAKEWMKKNEEDNSDGNG